MKYIYVLKEEIFLNSYGEYQIVFVIDKKPLGALKKYVRLFNPPRLSPFKISSHVSCSKLFILDFNFCGFMTYDKLPELISFLKMNDYIVEQADNVIYITYCEPE